MSKRKCELSASMGGSIASICEDIFINALLARRDSLGTSCALEYNHCWTWFVT